MPSVGSRTDIMSNNLVPRFAVLSSTVPTRPTLERKPQWAIDMPIGTLQRCDSRVSPTLRLLLRLDFTLAKSVDVSPGERSHSVWTTARLTIAKAASRVRYRTARRSQRLLKVALSELAPRASPNLRAALSNEILIIFSRTHLAFAKG